MTCWYELGIATLELVGPHGQQNLPFKSLCAATFSEFELEGFIQTGRDLCQLI